MTSNQHWSRLIEEFSIGDFVEVEVTHITSYRTYVVNKTKKLEGFINTKEISWDFIPRDIFEIKEKLPKGKKLKVKIIEIQNFRRRFGLSVRMMEKDPWDNISEKYKKEYSYPVTVFDIGKKRVLVLLEEGIEGRIGVEEIPKILNTKREVAKNNKYSRNLEYINEIPLFSGDTVVASIIEINKRDREITLSINRHLQKLKNKITFGNLLRVEQRRESSAIKEYNRKVSDWLYLAHKTKVEKKIETILIVDDDVPFLHSTFDLLSETGFDKIDIAKDFIQGEKRISDSNYDLYLIDVDLRNGEEKNGGVLIKKIREKETKNTVIAITAKPLIEFYSKIDNVRSLLNGFLIKPIFPEDLFKVVLGVTFSNTVEKEIITNDFRSDIEWEIDDLLNESGDLTIVFDQLLYKLIEKTGGLTLLATINKESKEVHFISSSGISKEKFNENRINLWKSPIRDVIIDGKIIFEHNVLHKKEQYLYLFPIFDEKFRSCIGIPIKVFDEIEHGIFLFHPKENSFSKTELNVTKRYAQIISILLTRQSVNEIFQREQSAFLAGRMTLSLAHTLRHILGTIENETNVLLLKGNKVYHDRSEGKYKEFFNEFMSSMARLKKHHDNIEELVDFYLPIKEEESPIKVDINQLINRTVFMLNPLFSSSNITVNQFLDNSIDAFYINTRMIEQVLLNVLFNAFEQIEIEREVYGAYKPEEGSIIIESNQFTKNGIEQLQIRIKDNSVGIHKIHFDSVFEKSFSTRGKGAGYGLYLSRQIMNRLRGQIIVEESFKFIGTTFLIELPMIDS